MVFDNTIFECKISDNAERRLHEIMQSYPDKRSAVMPALYIAQEEFGWISNDAARWVAEQIGISVVEVLEVATFCAMFRTAPLGKYHIQLCRTLSCALRKGEELRAYIEKRLSVSPKEVTSDGVWSYEIVECLGSCGTGPALQINDILFEFMNVDKLSFIMDRIELEQPELSYSTVTQVLGGELSDHVRSQIWVGHIVEAS